MNRALREQDMTKVKTLGPFCFILNFYIQHGSHQYNSRYFRGVVYRGSNQTLDEIELYKTEVGSYRKWLGFTSTSRNREKAEQFGNTLFIIDMQNNYYIKYRTGMDISKYSHYLFEEEVLLPAGIPFKIENVEYCNEKQKYFIY
ncbi:unnamed protein product, partial [Didymodactylos carnosus]